MLPTERRRGFFSPLSSTWSEQSPNGRKGLKPHKQASNLEPVVRHDDEDAWQCRTDTTIGPANPQPSMEKPRTRQDPYVLSSHHPHVYTVMHELIHAIPSHCKTGNCFFHQAPDSCPPPRRRLQGSRPIRTPRAVPARPPRPPRTAAPQRRRRILRCFCFASTGLGILVQQQRVVQRSVVVLCPSEISRRTPYRVPTGLRREIDGVPGRW